MKFYYMMMGSISLLFGTFFSCLISYVSYPELVLRELHVFAIEVRCRGTVHGFSGD